ncbi:hypothetical protein DSCW_35650 [Desulfosarcina widdelii]|uniref:Uncharacterized protein n=1 Tax=Desulfosarcina widdelii TaxID=947919 RepID=A0A5K7Z567_9BACT|nr:hypothetical protein [Desulfosarcina widdelii]BBO76148.1 hypothetical protein DSCW_35650 [Desulfosarcina widdelii]
MKIPRYERLVDAPSKTMQPASNVRMPLNDPANSGLKEAAAVAGGISEQAQQRYEQRQHERRAMGVADAVSKIRQFETESIIPLYSLKGKDAIGDINDPEKTPGIYRRGKKLYEDEIERIRGSILDPKIQAAFKIKASTVLSDALESLARHEATEHQILKQNTYETTLAQLVQNVSINWSNADVLTNSIEEIKTLADETFPGLDMSVSKQAAESALRATAIKRMADVSPQTALNHLKAWKDKLLPDTYEQLKNPILSEAVFDAAIATHGTDYDAMLDSVSKSSHSQDVKTTVASWIRSRRAEHERRNTEALKQRRVEGYNKFWGYMREGKQLQAMKVAGGLNSNDFTQQEINNLEQYARQVVTQNNDLLEKDLHVKIRTGAITDMHQIYAMPEMQQLTVESLRRLEGTIQEEAKLPSGYKAGIDALEQRFDRVFKDTDYYNMKPLFLSELLTDIEREEASRKKKLSTQDIISIGNQLLDLHTESMPWYRPDKKYRPFENIADEYGSNQAQDKEAAKLMTQKVDQIDPHVRDGIIQTLQLSGRKPYTEHIWNLFKHAHPADALKIEETFPGAGDTIH